MNISNVSALAISVPLENLPEKINEIQSLRFAIEAIHPTLDKGVRIVARLIKEGEDKQTYKQVEPLLELFMQQMNQMRDGKKVPYVW